MTEFEKVLINRDGATAKQAKEERNRLREDIYDMLAEGATYDEIEDLIADEAGLEMDYIFDLI